MGHSTGVAHRQTPARPFVLAQSQVLEGVLHDVVDFLSTPISDDIGARPSWGRMAGIKCRLKGRKVTEAHKLGALRHGFGHGFVGQLRQ